MLGVNPKVVYLKGIREKISPLTVFWVLFISPLFLPRPDPAMTCTDVSMWDSGCSVTVLALNRYFFPKWLPVEVILFCWFKYRINYSANFRQCQLKRSARGKELTSILRPLLDTASSLSPHGLDPTLDQQLHIFWYLQRINSSTRSVGVPLDIRKADI